MVAEKTIVLNRTHFRKFAQVLEEKASEVLSRVDARATTVGDEKARLSNEGDLAERYHEEWVTSSRDHLDHVLLFQIKDALNRVETGDLGECQGCGKAISVKRLKAVPWTRRCIECQDSAADAA